MFWDSLPERDLTGTASGKLTTWRHLQKIKQDFWKRWHIEYLNKLNIQRKWHKGEHNVKPNSLILLRDDNLPPLRWRLGRVLETIQDAEGIAGTVIVKTQTGNVTRAIKKLAELSLYRNM